MGKKQTDKVNKELEKLPEDKRKMLEQEGLLNQNMDNESFRKPTFTEKYVATPEQLQQQTADRDDVVNAEKRSIGGNPAVNFIDRVNNNATGLNDPKVEVGIDEAIEEAGKFESPEMKEKREEAQAKRDAEMNGGEPQNTVEADTVEADTIPPTNGVPAEADAEDSNNSNNNSAEKRYSNSVMSIWDAYNKGLIDKQTAGYFTIDALSQFAKNTGRSIGNIGAQFTGGTIDNNTDESLWSQRRDNTFANELTGEMNKQEDTDRNLEYQSKKADLVAKGLSNEQADRALGASRYFASVANDTTLPKAVRDAYKLLASASTSDIGVEEWVGLAGSELAQTEQGKSILNAIGTIIKNGGDGAANLTSFLNKITAGGK